MWCSHSWTGYICRRLIHHVVSPFLKKQDLAAPTIHDIGQNTRLLKKLPFYALFCSLCFLMYQNLRDMVQSRHLQHSTFLPKKVRQAHNLWQNKHRFLLKKSKSAVELFRETLPTHSFDLLVEKKLRTAS